MSQKLKLFIWENILTDWQFGIAFALAPDVETARKMLLEECDYLPAEDLAKEPKVCSEPVAYVLAGGG